MTTTHKLFAAAAATFALLAGTAQAQTQPSGVVLGIAGGISQYNDSCEGVSSCDKTDRAIRLNAGYGLGNGLVIEVVSLDFGKLKGTDAGISAEIKGSALGAGVAYYAPVSPSTSFYGRLGLAKGKVKVTARGFGITVSDSESSNTVYAGLGLAWNLNASTAVELGFDTTTLKYDGEKEGVNAFTVGLSFRF
jgi:hypothetical protein